MIALLAFVHILFAQDELKPEKILHEKTGIIVNFPDHPTKKSTNSGGTLAEIYQSKGPEGSLFIMSVYYRDKIRGVGETTEEGAQAIIKDRAAISKVFKGTYGGCPATFLSGSYPDTGEKFYVWVVSMFDTVIQLGVAQVKDRPIPEKAAEAFFDSLVLYTDMVHPTGPREIESSDMKALTGAFTNPILEHVTNAPQEISGCKFYLFNLVEGNVTYQLMTLEPPPAKQKEGLSRKAIDKWRDEITKEMGSKRKNERKLRIGPAEAIEFELEAKGNKTRLRMFVLGTSIYIVQYAETGGFDSDRATKFLDSFHTTFRSFR